jgi:D-alanyl-D-alanine carboxypeptidase
MMTEFTQQNNRVRPSLVDGIDAAAAPARSEIARRSFLGASLGAACLLAASRSALALPRDESKGEKRDPAGLQKELESIHAASWAPGLAAARVGLDGVTMQFQTGLRQRKSPEKIEPGDPFHLGSNTKSMTATLAAFFVHEKKIEWTTTVEEVLAPRGVKVDPEFGKATLRHLLSHRSGLAQLAGNDPRWAALWRHAGPPEEARREYVLSLVDKPPKWKVGTHFQYSNEGFIIAGHLLEVITGKSWETLMREQLFEPLGMKSAGFGPPGSAEKVDAPRGHTSWWKAVPPGKSADNPPGLGPAGTVHANLEDWGKFIAFNLRAAQGKEPRLPKKLFDELTTPPDKLDKYALGWVTAQRDWAGGKAIWHNGSNTMWYAVAWLAPEKGFAALAACNQAGSNASSACDKAISLMIDAG